MGKKKEETYEDRVCPVLSSYFLHAKRRFDTSKFAALVGDVKDEIEDLERAAYGVVPTRRVQVLRAFYCLEVIGGTLNKGGHIENIKKERTHKGLTEAINEAEMVQRGLKVKVATKALSSRVASSASWKQQVMRTRADRMKEDIGRAYRLEEAARYLRPRIRNTESLYGMGKFAVEALYQSRASGDVYVTCARDLINITETNGILG